MLFEREGVRIGDDLSLIFEQNFLCKHVLLLFGYIGTRKKKR
jgi:hypothetical protein